MIRHIATFLLLLGLTATALATSKVDPFYGSFGTEVPIVVPPFHSLEPQLKLIHTSTGKNGVAGVGWDLSGIGAIERMSPGGGAPKFDASDVYYLDGQELVASTSMGGTHATRIQSYLRIQKDVPSAGKWTVKQKDGTTSVFNVVSNLTAATCNTCAVANTCTITNCGTCGQSCTGGTDKYGNCLGWSCNSCSVTNAGFCGSTSTQSCSACGTTYTTSPNKWGLATVTDTSGNTVTYNWTCPGDGECYPASVTYNGNTITFYREVRPDNITFGNGVGIASRAYRLKSIDVKVGASRARAYKLAYTTSASTSRSLLASVQQFGRDANVDASGTVTAGATAPLPAMTFAYQPGGSASNTCYQTCYDACPINCDKYGNCDPPSYTCNPHNCNPYSCSSFLGKTYDANGGWDFGNSATNFPVIQGDWNGDGKADLARLGGAGAYVFRSNGNGTFTRSYDANPGWDFGNTDASYTPLTGDWNGDGKSDFVRLGGTGTFVFMSNGNGTFARSHDPNPGWDFTTSASNYPGITGDWNGDGRTDFARLGGAGVFVFMSNGNGTFTRSYDTNPGWDFGNTTQHYPPMAADWNGDGKTDFLRAGGTGVYVFRSNGNGTFTKSLEANPGWDFGTTGADYPLVAGDWNADGRGDFARLGGTGVYVFAGNGNGTFTRSYDANGGWDFGTSSANYPAISGDLNGDNRTDIVRLGGPGNYVFRSNGNGTFTRSYDVNPGWDFGISSSNFPRLAADWDGDGNTDFARLGGTGVYVFKVAGAIADLLITVGNGVGGTTQVSYTPSSLLANTYLPVGTIVQVAASLTTTDGRGASSTSSYTYAGGLWANAERRFLGFRKVTAVIDAAGNYTETYYHQHVGCVAKPETTYYRDPGGAIYSYSQMYYAENGAAPYTSLMTERWDYECNLDASCQRKVSQLGYDQYGNATTTYEYGDYDVAGDERTTVRGYVPNTSSFIVGHPAYENMFVGIGTAGALARQVLFVYDANAAYTSAPTAGRLTKKHLWKNNTGTHVTVQHGFDAWGNQISDTGPGGGVKTKTYDPIYHVYPISECDQLGRCTSTTWDYVLGSETAVTDINGSTITSTFDALGRPVRRTRPGGSYEDFTYLNWGNPALQRVRSSTSDGSADGLWIETYYDGLQRDWRTVKEGGLTADTIYPDAGNRSWKTSNWYVAGETVKYTTNLYDGAGRLRKKIHPDGTFAEVVYGDGSVTFYDELGHWQTRVLDGYGRLKRVHEQGGGITTHTYNVMDDRISTTDAAGNLTTMTYNSLGQRLQLCDPDTGCTSFVYGAIGQVTSQTNAKGQTLTFAYDPLGRLRTTTYPNGTQVVVTFDEAGHGAGRGKATTITDPTGSESRAFDWAGRLTSVTKCVYSVCKTTSSTYDVAGRERTVTYPDGEVVTYGYAANGRLATVSGYVNGIGYNSAGQITSMTYANGTTSTYTYNTDRAAMLSAAVTGPAGTLFQASYAYDAAAHIKSTTSSTNPLMNVSYTYDVLDRLTAVTGAQTQSFAYDALGNMTYNSAVGTYAYASGKKHAVTTAGANTYAYDANGNMISGAGRALAWDYENRLTSVTAAGTTTSFGYDHQGLRVWKSSPAGDVRTFNGRVEVEGTTLVKYYYAGPIMVAKRTPSAAHWYHSDHLGSVKVMTNSSGAKVQSYDYAPFGVTLAATGSVANDRKFQGHKSEAAGLIFMNARYYDPALGRFISADSIVPDGANPQALNRYSFVYNNPIMNTDPSGHAPVVAAVVAIVASITTVQWVAIAIMAVGYITKSPVLMSIGSIMLGYPNVAGMLVAAAASPISPLSPRVKQAIGWAWTIYNLFSAFGTEAQNASAADKLAAERNQAALQANQNASGNVVLKETTRWQAFADNRFSRWAYETFGLNPDHIVTTFTFPDKTQAIYNVQTIPRGNTFFDQLLDLVETSLGTRPVFNSSDMINLTNKVGVATEFSWVSVADVKTFGDAYVTNMRANAIFGVFYNPGQSNNAFNAATAAVGTPSYFSPSRPGCLLCK